MYRQHQSYMKKEESIQKLRDVIRLRHFSYSTEQSYCSWINRYARFVSERCKAGSPNEKMEAFLTQLAKQDVSASTQTQAFNAILFFYREVLKQEVGKVDSLRAKKPVHLRFAPELDEVRQLIAATQDVGGYPTRLIVKLIYGCGLRVSEPLNLRVKDVLPSESKLVIRGAKGGKDRFVSLPCSLVPELTAQLAFAKSVGEQDRLNRVPVALPGLLATKVEGRVKTTPARMAEFNWGVFQ